jgi:hypothetical protein
MISAVLDDPRIRFLKLDEFDVVVAELDDEATKVFELPAGVSTKFDFFAQARLNLPLNPPLGFHYRDHEGEYSESWDALSDSLEGGIVRDVAEPRVVIVWRDPGTLASSDQQAHEIALDILLALPSEAASSETNGGYSKDVIVLLGRES